jgi:hydroxypyruvate reductase
MGSRRMQSQRAHLADILDAALGAAMPYDSVGRCLHRAGNRLVVGTGRGLSAEYDLTTLGHVRLVGCGKAAAPMARAVATICGDRLTEGVVVTKLGHTGEWSSPRIRVHEASHPTPDERGVKGASEVLAMLGRCEESDLVIAVVSGGGSALWSLPGEGIRLEDMRNATETLIGCGADIEQMNCVRKHISRIKGGWAARAAFPAEVLVVVVSDVIGDRLDVIASGPFYPDPTTYYDALRIMEDRGVWMSMPESIRGHIGRGMAGHIPETPTADARCFERIQHVVCANNTHALQGAARKAAELGYESRIVNTGLSGQARDAAGHFCEQILGTANSTKGPVCLISGGETTVTLGESYGRGGRNQEFALAAALHIEERPDIAILSCGTDGTDGPTDAAGAFVDGSTVRRAHQRGLNPREALQGHASYDFFHELGDLIITGPTQTNVMDMQVAIIG